MGGNVGEMVAIHIHMHGTVNTNLKDFSEYDKLFILQCQVRLDRF